MFSFLKEETFGLRTQKTFTGSKCKIYIPDYFFKDGIASDLGNRIETMGILMFNVDGELYDLSMPIKFQFEYSDSEKVTTKLTPEMPEIEFVVYTLNRGDAFMYNMSHKQNVDDIKADFIDKLIEKAKLPPTVRYENVMQTLLNALVATNHVNLGVSGVSYEFILATLCRSRKSMNTPFRKAYDGKNGYGYKMSRITKIPELESTFTGITGEDINHQLVSGVLKSRNNVEEKESPIEKMIKY